MIPKYEYMVFDLRVKEIPEAKDVEVWMKRAIRQFGFVVENVVSHIFGGDPHAYTTAFILSESHAVVHTAPEYSWVEVVFAFCKSFDRQLLIDIVSDFFMPLDMRVHEFAGRPPMETL